MGKEKGDKGNSILVRLTEYKYAFIGDHIIEFTLDRNSDPITKFYSNIGNSQVSYPIALSKSKAYYLLQNDMKFLYRDNMKEDGIIFRNELADSYGYYYRNENNAEKMKNIKDIVSRQF